MLQSSESETEILLGNKQLLGIFFVVVILLGVAFAGGYKVGQSSAKKTAVAAQTTPDETAASSTAASTGGETHAFPAADARHTSDTAPPEPGSGENSGPLGSRKRSQTAKIHLPSTAPRPTEAPYASVIGYEPQAGQTFLQVVAAGRDEAEAIADVLHKKGFHAHAVPKPGGTKLYRVLIGPIRDAGDLSSTRDLLRKTGFREIFVQRY